MYDLYAAFGFGNVIDAILRGKQKHRHVNTIYKMTNIKGFLSFKHNHIKISYDSFDISGFDNSFGLGKLANSMGLSMEDKGKLDKYKVNMGIAMMHSTLETRLLYARYSMDDAEILINIFQLRVKQHNNNLRDCFGFPTETLFSENYLPSTLGKLISNTIVRFIYLQAIQETSLRRFLWARFKIGLLDPTKPNYEENVKIRSRLIDDPSYLDQVDLNHFSTNVYKHDAFNASSIPFLILFSAKNTFLFTSAMVTAINPYGVHEDDSSQENKCLTKVERLASLREVYKGSPFS